jgi:hypothetical protein
MSSSESDDNKNVVFIILRHVNNELTNQYWQLACHRIRQYHPESPIYIIDDYSKSEWLTPISAVEGLGRSLECACLAEQQHIHVITSELHPGHGEFLPLYYFHKYKWSARAVILHDSVFLQSRLPIPDTDGEPVKFIWSFDSNLTDEREAEWAQISHLNYAAELIPMYNHHLGWNGCFGVMTYITWDYLNHLNKKYNLFGALVGKIATKLDRCCMERTFAIICQHDHNRQKLDGMFGHILDYVRRYQLDRSYGTTYMDYMKTPMLYAHAPLVKVWSGR